MLEEALIGNSAPDCPLFLAAMAAFGMFIGRLGVDCGRLEVAAPGCVLSAKSCLPTVVRNFPGSGQSRGNDWYGTGSAPSNRG